MVQRGRVGRGPARALPGLCSGVSAPVRQACSVSARVRLTDGRAMGHARLFSHATRSPARPLWGYQRRREVLTGFDVTRGTEFTGATAAGFVLFQQADSPISRGNRPDPVVTAACLEHGTRGADYAGLHLQMRRPIDQYVASYDEFPGRQRRRRAHLVAWGICRQEAARRLPRRSDEATPLEEPSPTLIVLAKGRGLVAGTQP